MATFNEKSGKNLLEQEKKILKEEKLILREIKQEEKTVKKAARSMWIATIVVSIAIVGGAFGLVYWNMSGSTVYTDNAKVSAPHVNLSPSSQGILQQIFVNEGDMVDANTVVARVGNELIKTQSPGLIIGVNNNIGTLFNPGQTVVTMIDPSQLRLVGTIDEDKGLSNIHIGQAAKFTVDAFGSKTYQGVVDEISPASKQGDIVFNISDKRQVNQFDVKVRFDTSLYPELKDGMSARLWIYK